ncbi:hypothetical protein [Kitasatospora sp. NPDC087315]|uniref:hypothetical protein n=1 Tax=Kitasatospora sp. NPDC087315 TaxID=3364069 RepID=UPI0038267DC3
MYDDLIPAFRTISLDDFRRPHIRTFADHQLTHGRGRATVHRMPCTLSSALGDAVPAGRLHHNVGRPLVIRRPRHADRIEWTTDHAATFLRYTHGADPPIADLTELLIGPGIRKGEALTLHEDDAYLDKRFMYIHWTLSAIDNTELAFTEPKTRSSRNWVALSDRATAAIAHRLAPDTLRGPNPAPGHGLVIHRHGRPLHPSTS